MSRKGKMPITLPKGVEVKVTGDVVSVKGAKGTLTLTLQPGITLKIENGVLHVESKETTREASRMHGLYRSLVENMLVGTATGFEKRLEMVGVGYRAAVQGSMLDLQIGCSHETKLEIPKGLAVKVDKNTNISITGIDRQAVGQFAAQVRAMKPPEPYQGKGIRYEGEYVRKKAGKAAKTAAATAK
jgi:large subunit ribosomal protein L6